MSSIKFPITVNKITYGDNDIIKDPLFGDKCGDLVSVRPYGEKYENKTYLGILLGELPLSVIGEWNSQAGELKISRCMYNPMIFIPEAKSIVFGCGSWWGRIENEEQLRQITDADIQDNWYVKLLRTMSRAEEEWISQKMSETAGTEIESAEATNE